MGTLAIPKPDAYVLEWEAHEIQGPSDIRALRKLVKNTPWVVQIILENDEETFNFVFSQMHPSGMEQWSMTFGDWVVKSPHGKIWFMGNSEFASQFEVVES